MNRRTKTTPKGLEDRARQDRALTLRRTGMTYQQIADELGYATKTGAHGAVMASLDRQPFEDAQIVKRLELERLDGLFEVAWDQVHRDHVMVSDGRVVKDDVGVPLVDHGPKMAALDRALKIMDRRARYLGLDAPTRKVVEVVPTDVVASEIRRLEAELAGNDPKGIGA